jgi:transcriptional regulator with GAF, ATPase, and Fis domain
MSGRGIDGTTDATAGPTHAARLTETFVELADTLVDDFDLIEFLYTLVNRCVELVDVSAVGLMIGDGRGRLQVMASSTEEARLLELFQLQNGEGPCLQCFRSGQPVQESDLRLATPRWPMFAPEAVRAGFRTVHALPMRLRTRTIGALNLFHVRADALADSEIRIAQALVDIATIGLIQVDMGRRQDVLLDQLEAVLELRIAIEQAKGVVAQIRGITPPRGVRPHARLRHRAPPSTDRTRPRGHPAKPDGRRAPHPTTTGVGTHAPQLIRGMGTNRRRRRLPLPELFVPGVD